MHTRRIVEAFPPSHKRGVVCLWFPHEGRVPHISLVFREMWDTTALSLRLSIHPTHLAVNIGGIPHLAKNERDMGHGGFKEQVQHFPLGDSCIWGRVFNI